MVGAMEEGLISRGGTPPAPEPSIFCSSFRTVNDREPTYTVYSRLARGPPGTDGELLCHHIEQEYRVGPLELNREAIWMFPEATLPGS